MATPAVSRPTLNREQQLAQLHRRYGSGPIISLKPSDPDFVYPLPSLQIRLHVPESYPAERPWIDVLNGELPGWAKKNVQEGFKAIAARGRERWEQTTLLDLLRVLDRELEDLLSAGGEEEDVEVEARITSGSGSRSETPTPASGAGSGMGIKIVRPVPERIVPTLTPPPPPAAIRPPSPPGTAGQQAVQKKPAPVRSFTQAERTAAGKKRSQDIKQLISRLKLSPVFSGSPDATHFTVPIDCPRKLLLPVALQPVNSARLIVPKHYNLEPPRIELPGVPSDIARRVEESFEEFAANNPQMTLTAAVNALAAKLHLWAVEDKPVKKEKEPEPEDVAESEDAVDGGEKNPSDVDPGKAHIKVIPRPPEWALPDDGEDEDSDGSSGPSLDSDEDSDEEIEHDHNPEMKRMEPAPNASQPTSEHGTSLSCPGVEMKGIDLLMVAALNITIKCVKCKTEQDILNLRGTRADERPMPRVVRCSKCSEILAAGFRKEFAHQNSARLGFFDLTNCTIAELRPMDLVPQCEECSDEEIHQELKGVVRGQTVFTNCRKCFKRMSLLIPEFKLLRIGGERSLELKKVPKKATTKERYVAGTELPFKGKCKHYRKSTRWFRFSCCNNVYPCDRCHDAAESHPSEHANRMICGLCSREQNYRPEDCRYCGNNFIKRSMSKFWEGGKGTRDRRLMSKNDPRKYKRLGKPL